MSLCAEVVLKDCAFRGNYTSLVSFMVEDIPDEYAGVGSGDFNGGAHSAAGSTVKYLAVRNACVPAVLNEDAAMARFEYLAGGDKRFAAIEHGHGSTSRIVSGAGIVEQIALKQHPLAVFDTYAVGEVFTPVMVLVQGVA
jgi:hypothetical protein